MHPAVEKESAVSQKEQDQELLDALERCLKVAERGSGEFAGASCARAYVQFYQRGTYATLTREQRKLISDWAKLRGKVFQKKGHMGLQDCVYFGYDNATGRTCGMASDFEIAFNYQNLPVVAIYEALED